MNSFDHTQDWFYEGNVSKNFVEYLKEEGHIIEKDNSDNPKAKGIDIISEKDDIVYLTEVKGYPSEYYVSGDKQGQKKPTSPKLQAKHWLSEAILSTMFNYGKEKEKRKGKEIELSVVLPKHERYRELLEQLSPFIKDLCTEAITFYMVDKNGEVEKFKIIG
jgi:Holliday junction resolvase-like predicted endonuclease